jgi:hypothetical protein
MRRIAPTCSPRPASRCSSHDTSRRRRSGAAYVLLAGSMACVGGQALGGIEEFEVVPVGINKLRSTGCSSSAKFFRFQNRSSGFGYRPGGVKLYPGVAGILVARQLAGTIGWCKDHALVCRILSPRSCAVNLHRASRSPGTTRAPTAPTKPSDDDGIRAKAAPSLRFMHLVANPSRPSLDRSASRRGHAAHSRALRLGPR